MRGTVACTSAMHSATIRAKWPSSGIMLFPYQCLLRFAHRLVRALDGVGCFGRHVILIVLGQHFLGVEYAVWAQLALRHHAFALLEQVGKDTGIAYGRTVRGVRYHELHRQAIGLSCEAAGLHQAAQAERATLWGFMRSDLGRAVKENEVALKGVENQRGGTAQRHQARDDQCQSLVTRLHLLILFDVTLRLTLIRQVRRRRRSDQISSAITTAATK